jgi:hypothetical protein
MGEWRGSGAPDSGSSAPDPPDPDPLAADLDLSGDDVREHYRLALAVAQAAWDHLGRPGLGDGEHDELRAALLALRRHEIDTKRPMLAHPMVRRHAERPGQAGHQAGERGDRPERRT